MELGIPFENLKTLSTQQGDEMLRRLKDGTPAESDDASEEEMGVGGSSGEGGSNADTLTGTHVSETGTSNLHNRML